MSTITDLWNGILDNKYANKPGITITFATKDAFKTIKAGLNTRKHRFCVTQDIPPRSLIVSTTKPEKLLDGRFQTIVSLKSAAEVAEKPRKHAFTNFEIEESQHD